MNEFGPEDKGSDIDPETGNFIKKHLRKRSNQKILKQKKPKLILSGMRIHYKKMAQLMNIGKMLVHYRPKRCSKNREMNEFGVNYQKQKKIGSENC